jgi:hypothetical protein
MLAISTHFRPLSLAAPLFEAVSVQRNLQPAEQVGQGLPTLPGLRCGPVFLHANPLPGCEARPVADRQFVFKKSHFGAAASYSGSSEFDRFPLCACQCPNRIASWIDSATLSKSNMLTVSEFNSFGVKG